MGQGLGVAVSCGVGFRHGSDPTIATVVVWAGICSSDSTPSLGSSICRRCSPKKQKKKKKRKEKINLKIVHQTIGSQGPSVEAGQSRPHKPRSGSVMGGDALKIEDLK